MVLPRVEGKIAALQQEMVDNLALRANQRWRELGEVSAGYLKNTIATRQARRLISAIQHPTTGVLSSSSSDMSDAIHTFYHDLYSPADIDQPACDALLANIPSSCRLSPSQCHDIIEPFDILEIQLAAKRAPRLGSPGPDGLPYTVWYLVFKHLAYHDLTVQIFREALLEARFPHSWTETCVSLLPKKGDLTSLRNWRSIMVITTNAKIFTRLVNTRLTAVAPSLITPFQTGFLPGRFIADNGLLVKLVMEQARESLSSSALGILLDHEKAYDRIHL